MTRVVLVLLVVLLVVLFLVPSGWWMPFGNDTPAGVVLASNLWSRVTA